VFSGDCLLAAEAGQVGVAARCPPQVMPPLPGAQPQRDDGPPLAAASRAPAASRSNAA
jgi:hypothetical protein